MRDGGRVAEDDVVAAFVRAELDSPKFGRAYRQIAEQLGISIERLRGSGPVTAERRLLLRGVRGFPDRLLFDGFPRDVRWSRAEATIDDLKRLRFIKIGNWLQLAPKTRTVNEGVRVMRAAGFAIPEIDLEGCDAIAARVRAGEKLPELILARASDGSMTILEGNSRATAYVAFPDIVGEGIDVFVGSSPAIQDWRFF